MSEYQGLSPGFPFPSGPQRPWFLGSRVREDLPLMLLGTRLNLTGPPSQLDYGHIYNYSAPRQFDRIRGQKSSSVRIVVAMAIVI